MANSLKRIMRDYKDLVENDYPFSIAPVNDNLYIWHGNLVPRYGRYVGFMIHYEVSFSEKYPQTPPDIFIRTRIPHSNVFEGWNENPENYSICLDLIKFINKKKNDKEYWGGWSPAYSLATILMQLESFLFEDYAEQDYGHGVQRTYNGNKYDEFMEAYQHTKNYKCPQCDHTYYKPYPELKFEIPELRLSKDKVVKIHECDQYQKKSQTENEYVLGDEYSKWLEEQLKDSKKKETILGSISCDLGDILTQNDPNEISNSIYNLCKIKSRNKDECHWYLKKEDKFQKVKKFIEEHQINTSAFDCCCKHYWDICIPVHSCGLCQNSSHELIHLIMKKGYYDEELNFDCIKSVNHLKYLKEGYDLSKINSIVERFNYLLKHSIISCINSKNVNNPFCIFENFLSLMNCYGDLKPYDQTPEIKYFSKTGSSEVKSEKNKIKLAGSGVLFFGLPYELKLLVGNKLKFENRVKFAKLDEEHFKDCAYHERKSMICYYSKLKMDDKITLGYPLTIEYFKESSTIKHIDFGLDLLSDKAYFDGARYTAYNVNIQFWLPVYSEKPFKNFLDEVLDQIMIIGTSTKRVRYNLNNICYEDEELTGKKIEIKHLWYSEDEKQIYQDRYGSSWNGMDEKDLKVQTYEERLDNLKKKMKYPKYYQEEIILNILTTLMSGSVVEMMKGDVVVSNKALEAFCRFHGLLIEFKNKFPKIEFLVDQKIKDFIKGNVSKRHKNTTPNLGKFVCYLTITEKYSWIDIQELYLEESYKRNIRWIKKCHPEMNPDNSFYFLREGRLDKIWNVIKVGKKLTLFYHYFITQIARPKRKKLKDILIDYKRHYGFPSRKIRDTFQIEIKKINQVNSFKEFNKRLELREPDPKYLSRQFYWAWQISDKIGYNN